MKASEKPYGLKGGIIRRNNEMHQYFNLGSLIIQLRGRSRTKTGRPFIFL